MVFLGYLSYKEISILNSLCGEELRANFTESLLGNQCNLLTMSHAKKCKIVKKTKTCKNGYLGPSNKFALLWKNSAMI